uniref:N-acetyltransferase domain-containing protein n=1 Tax=Guillardia theta TaxID=55529 RepID=A0A7S4NNE8_GUITH|mmetsp:Transcript_27468/g.89488  ORF Transcript_27468/g.89488 Transcript_27468/m.89488 type:complete len:510 (+) Transcript_27468:205-1734(+)
MDFLFAERNARKNKEKFHLDLIRGDVASAEKIVSFFKNLSRNIVNEYDGDGYLPIHHAAAAGKVSSCEFLIKNKCDVTKTVHPLQERSSLRTCLHFAAISRNADVVSLLLKHGADPHTKDALKQRPIDLAKDGTCWQLLKRAMNTQTNVNSSHLLLDKISAAFNCVVRVPSMKMSSNHAARLEKSYVAWETEVDGKHPPYRIPSLSWMQDVQSNADVGMLLVLIKNVEKLRKIPLNGLIRAQSVKYQETHSLEICDLWVRQDCRRERLGSVLLFSLFVTYAKKNYKSALCRVHAENVGAKAFFQKFGFRRMINTSIPRYLIKPNFEAFELRDIGDSLERFQVLFADYKNIAIVDDEHLMEEARADAEEARNRRIEEKKERQKNNRDPDMQMALGMEAALHQLGEGGPSRAAKAEGPWWTRPRPLSRQDGKPWIEIPQEFQGILSQAPKIAPTDIPLLQGSSQETLPRLTSSRMGGRRDSSQERLVTELDRVPGYVLKEYESDVGLDLQC